MPLGAVFPPGGHGPSGTQPSGTQPPGTQPPGWPAPPQSGPNPGAPQAPSPHPQPNVPGKLPVSSAPPPSWPPGLPSPYGPNGGWATNLRVHGFALAPLGSRLVARIVDIIAVLLLNVILSWYLVLQYVHETAPFWHGFWYAFTHATSSKAAQDITPMSSRGQTLGLVILVFAVVIWAVYEVPSTARSGQTLGKHLLGIRVIGLEGATELGGRRAFRRWTPLGMGTLLWLWLIGFLIQGIDCLAPTINRPFRLALHDVYAATVVVAVPPKNSTPTPTDSTPDERETANGGTR
jgi:uncharacterized RDD family membrane protein YckC